MNQEKVDLLIQYVLSVAAQGWGDYDDKEVGPIHIIKYVYLADLAYALQNDGQTFTGIPWIFHHFGPWDTGLYQRIEPASRAIGAHKRTITDTQYADFDRWSLDSEHLINQLSKSLPNSITLSINGSFRRFGTDTYDLLDYVYSTIPMRYAAPGEYLLFVTAAQTCEQQRRDNETLQQYQPNKLTVRQQKHKKRIFSDLKSKIRIQIAEKNKKGRVGFVTPTAPRYDDLFWKGQEWLDSLAGAPINHEKGELTVSDSAWKTTVRSEPHV